jgi:hypothetical protein
MCDGNAWVVTRFYHPDGTTTEVHAHPRHDQHDIAQDLGYPNEHALTLGHDPMHTFVAQLLIHAASPTLLAVSHGEDVDTDLVRAEEAVVLAVQKWMNLRRQK